MVGEEKLKERLRALLKQQGYSYKSFADAVGCGEGTVLRACKGSIPDAVFLYKMAQTLGVTMEYLLTGKNPDVVESVLYREKLEELVQKLPSRIDLLISEVLDG